jgi:choline dehydrogenase
MKDFGEFDYVIVGGGTAGCVLANRLSADPDVTVLLLEAGGKDDWIWIHIPIGYLYCINNPRTDWCYKTEPSRASTAAPSLRARQGAGRLLLDQRHALPARPGPRLRGVGADHRRRAGTGKTCCRCSSAARTTGAAPTRCTATRASGASRSSACTGTSSTATSRPRSRPASLQQDYNRGDNFGIGHFEVNQKKGVRWNASKAMLRPVLHRPNLKVVTGALIDKLVMEGKRGARRRVQPRWAGQGTRVRARIETVLTAGAIGSPAILQRSGIGPAALLQQRGVPLVHDLPGVGGNLQDHLQLRMIFKVHGIKTLNQSANSLWGKAMMGLEYALFRSGPLSMAPSQLGGFFRSSPEVATPDLEFHVQPLSLDKFGDPLHRFPAFTASVCNLRPTSRGTWCISATATRRRRRSSRRTTCRPRTTARSPPAPCA